MDERKARVDKPLSGRMRWPDAPKRGAVAYWWQALAYRRPEMVR